MCGTRVHAFPVSHFGLPADGSAAPADASSASASGAPAATSLPAGLYAASSQATSGVRTNGVLAYQPFQSGAYDPFHAVSYQNSAPMMPHAYMVPAAIQQMYPANPSILSYQAAMNMLSPQHGQSSPNIYGNYRPQDGQQSGQQDQQDAQSQQQQHRSHEGSPATSTGVGTAAGGVKVENTESDDEGSKLNILSQLCSAVLDGTDAHPKQEPAQERDTQQEQQQQQQPPEVQQKTETAVKQETQSEQPPLQSEASTTLANCEVATGDASADSSDVKQDESREASKEEEAKKTEGYVGSAFSYLDRVT